jgi:hypothetical protein
MREAAEAVRIKLPVRVRVDWVVVVQVAEDQVEQVQMDL